MDYSALLHDWIDGTLAPEHEEAVFIALSRQADLRLELQDLMRIRAAVQSDAAAFTPSPSDTSAIFGRLGFSVPADIPSLASASIGVSTASSSLAASSGASALSGIAAFGGTAKLAVLAAWKSYGAVLVSACLASLVTVLLLDWRSGNLFQNGSNTSFRGGSASDMVSSANPVSAAASGFGNASGNNAGFGQSPYFAQGGGQPRYGVTTDTVRERIVIREVVRYVPMAATGQMSAIPSTDNPSANQQESASEDNSSFAPPALQSVPPRKQLGDDILAKAVIATRTALPDNTLKSASYLLPPPSSEESFADILHRFRLGVRGFTALSMPPPTMEPSATPFFNNAALSLQYALSPNRFIGVEVGQEAFFQRYQSTENQDTYTITQYPTQWWAGLTYRYNFTPEELFSPYASATLGVATYGFLGRTHIGCTYSPDGVTQFLLGVEASALVYGHQGVNYVSPKVGVTYGVSLRW